MVEHMPVQGDEGLSGIWDRCIKFIAHESARGLISHILDAKFLSYQR